MKLPPRSGDLDVEIDGAERQDEIGAIARSVIGFRANLADRAREAPFERPPLPAALAAMRTPEPP